MRTNSFIRRFLKWKTQMFPHYRDYEKENSNTLSLAKRKTPIKLEYSAIKWQRESEDLWWQWSRVLKVTASVYASGQVTSTAITLTLTVMCHSTKVKSNSWSEIKCDFSIRDPKSRRSRSHRNIDILIWRIWIGKWCSRETSENGKLLKSIKEVIVIYACFYL